MAQQLADQFDSHVTTFSFKATIELVESYLQEAESLLKEDHPNMVTVEVSEVSREKSSHIPCNYIHYLQMC